jgi:hypothetical protein
METSKRVLRRPSRFELVGPEGQRFTMGPDFLWRGTGPDGAPLAFELVEHVAAFLQCPWTELTSEEALDVSRD